MLTYCVFTLVMLGLLTYAQVIRNRHLTRNR